MVWLHHAIFAYKSFEGGEGLFVTFYCISTRKKNFFFTNVWNVFRDKKCMFQTEIILWTVMRISISNVGFFSLRINAWTPPVPPPQLNLSRQELNESVGSVSKVGDPKIHKTTSDQIIYLTFLVEKLHFMRKEQVNSNLFFLPIFVNFTGSEFLPQTQISYSLYLCNRLV